MAEQDIIWSYEFEKNKTLKPGQLLLSEPFMYDENFKRTVVLICEHNLTNGTVGLILNKPINLRLNELVENFPPFNEPVFLGGPVGAETIQFLHASEGKIEDSILIYKKGNDYDVVIPKSYVVIRQLEDMDYQYLDYLQTNEGKLSLEQTQTLLGTAAKLSIKQLAVSLR